MKRTRKSPLKLSACRRTNGLRTSISARCLSVECPRLGARLSVKMHAWFQYMDDFNEAHPYEAVYLYSIPVAYSKKKIFLNEAIFATKADPKWEEVAERIRKGMEHWWRNILKKPHAILGGMGIVSKTQKCWQSGTSKLKSSICLVIANWAISTSNALGTCAGKVIEMSHHGRSDKLADRGEGKNRDGSYFVVCQIRQMRLICLMLGWAIPLRSSAHVVQTMAAAMRSPWWRPLLHQSFL